MNRKYLPGHLNILLIILVVLLVVACRRLESDNQATSVSGTELPKSETTLTLTSNPQAGETPIRIDRLPSVSQLNQSILPYVHQLLDSSQYTFERFSKSSSMNQADVDGDGENDLIIHDDFLLVVLLWQHTYYKEPFIHFHPPDKYNYASVSRVSLIDWTADETPEIFYEYIGGTGGTGLFTRYWERTIIHCLERCIVVWNEVTDSLSRGETMGRFGFSQFQSDLYIRAEGEELFIEQNKQAFTFNIDIPAFMGTDQYVPTNYSSLYVFPQTLLTFKWTGSMFSLMEERVLQEAYEIESTSVLTAVNNEGTTASISTLTDYLMNMQVCTLVVEGEQIGSEFGCKPRFSEISWENVVGDSDPELIVSAIVAPSALEILDLEPVSTECFHERFMVFTEENGDWQQIADTIGCLVDSSLSGVHLDDIEGDGQKEIIAESDNWFYPNKCTLWPPCWYELDQETRVYEWDGDVFASSQ